MDRTRSRKDVLQVYLPVAFNAWPVKMVGLHRWRKLVTVNHQRTLAGSVVKQPGGNPLTLAALEAVVGLAEFFETADAMIPALVLRPAEDDVGPDGLLIELVGNVPRPEVFIGTDEGR
ncbi:MAG: hypothetical protein ACJAZ9_000388 [Neolewinella sp.]